MKTYEVTYSNGCTVVKECYDLANIARFKAQYNNANDIKIVSITEKTTEKK